MDITCNTQDDNASIQCPYCGEWIELTLDLSIPGQSYIEDCQVCCRPIEVSTMMVADGTTDVTIRRDDD